MQKLTITAEEALSVLPDGDYIHTFRNPGAGMMIGADWSRGSIEEAIAGATEIRLCGSAARSMDHGIVIIHNGSMLFISTDEARLNAIDPLEQP